MIFCTRTTYEDNAITNAIEIYDTLEVIVKQDVNHATIFVIKYIFENVFVDILINVVVCSGGMHLMASINDCGVREQDMEGFQLVNHFRFPRPVNVCVCVFLVLIWNSFRQCLLSQNWGRNGMAHSIEVRKTCLFSLMEWNEPLRMLRTNSFCCNYLLYKSEECIWYDGIQNL